MCVTAVCAGGAHAAGGPFRKWFAAGRPAARRSRVGRAPAALVCTAGRARQLHVHPRDQFDNPAPLATVRATLRLYPDSATLHPCLGNVCRVRRGSPSRSSL